MLIREISPNDGMFDARHPAAYFEVGESALRCIRLAMAAVGKQTAQRILDFPSGHGRVLRTLRAAFPDAHLTACDIDRDGVDFCVETFGAEGVYSDDDLERVSLADGFDVIWVGSLFTHLPRGRWHDFLAFLTDRLAPGGLLLFTVHGPWCAQQLRDETSRLGGPRIRRETLSGYDRSGFGFADYEGRSGYGVSLASPSAVARELEAFGQLRLVLFLERGWGSHQDVVACQRGFTTSTA